ncbi:MAG: methylated-DNA--[protein]-cysteine S-methyltransferase [Treponema sp.]|nr:methylated-DNA--[protein]-cysteine S-methyltransferase [Treponema sp.]
MANTFYYTYETCNLKQHKLLITEKAGTVCNIYFNTEGMQLPQALNDSEKRETSLIKKTVKQLDEYFNGKRKVFELPLVLHGTDFQIKVWETLQTIPCGETRSYGQLAVMIGNPKASRAVGMANNRNPIPVIIPCHRIIGHDGSLTGYAGGLELKQILLDLEKQAINEH